jgi:hypothetical protein
MRFSTPRSWPSFLRPVSYQTQKFIGPLMPTAMGGLSAKTDTSGGRRLSAPRRFVQSRTIPALTKPARQRVSPSRG